MHDSHPAQKASSDLEGLRGCNFGVVLLLGKLPAMVHDPYLSGFGFCVIPLIGWLPAWALEPILLDYILIAEELSVRVLLPWLFHFPMVPTRQQVDKRFQGSLPCHGFRIKHLPSLKFGVISPRTGAGQSYRVWPGVISPRPVAGQSYRAWPGVISPRPVTGQSYRVCPGVISPRPVAGQSYRVCPGVISPRPVAGQSYRAWPAPRRLPPL